MVTRLYRFAHALPHACLYYRFWHTCLRPRGLRSTWLRFLDLTAAIRLHTHYLRTLRLPHTVLRSPFCYGCVHCGCSARSRAVTRLHCCTAGSTPRTAVTVRGLRVYRCRVVAHSVAIRSAWFGYRLLRLPVNTYTRTLPLLPHCGLRLGFAGSAGYLTHGLLLHYVYTRCGCLRYRFTAFARFRAFALGCAGLDTPAGYTCGYGLPLRRAVLVTGSPPRFTFTRAVAFIRGLPRTVLYPVPRLPVCWMVLSHLRYTVTRTLVTYLRTRRLLRTPLPLPFRSCPTRYRALPRCHHLHTARLHIPFYRVYARTRLRGSATRTRVTLPRGWTFLHCLRSCVLRLC